MKIRSIATLSPLCLCLAAGVAHAALEPFSFGASESVTHDSNVNRTTDNTLADWYTTTELRGAVNQPLGRDALVGSAAVNYNLYHRTEDKRLNAFGYRGALELDWSTIGDLSGAIGADAQRRRYTYGFEDAPGVDVARSLETDSHVFARASLGGPSRWNIFAGFDANRRNFSGEGNDISNEQQWSQNFGTTYSTSPDLSFGITGNYVRGEYPNYLDDTGNFNSKSLSATTRWQASGNSLFNGSLGYTVQDGDLQPRMNFISGSLYWNWTPPSHFAVSAGISRSSDGGATAGTVKSLNDRSINTTASLNVSYAVTAKISLNANGQYIRRKYESVTVPNVLDDGTVNQAQPTTVISGIGTTQRVALSAHYQPTRTTDLSCTVSRETRRTAEAELASYTPSYDDNMASCAASINFN